MKYALRLITYTSFQVRALIGPTLAAFLLCISVAASAEPTISHEFISLSGTGKKIEFYWAKPEGNGPWPVLLLIHPHQTWPNKIGGKAFVEWKMLEKWTSKGWVTIAMSQPGYGESDGPPDFCGPNSQQAAIDVISHFRSLPIVKPDSVVVYGGSRGAVVASMIAARDPSIAGVILRSGLYNFVEAYREYPWYSTIKFEMLWEIGWINDSDLTARSAFFAAEKIRSPLLILHGSDDDRAPLKYAKQFADKVKANGGKVEFVSFDSEHIIPAEKIATYMETFLNSLSVGTR